MFPKDPVDILLRCVETISQNKGAQNEDEDVGAGHPTRDLERNQEERSIVGRRHNTRTNDQDAGPKRFCDGSGIRTPDELRIRRKKPRQPIKEHDQQQQRGNHQTFSKRCRVATRVKAAPKINQISQQESCDQ